LSVATMMASCLCCILLPYISGGSSPSVLGLNMMVFCRAPVFR
jgi:hypothetical protein